MYMPPSIFFTALLIDDDERMKISSALLLYLVMSWRHRLANDVIFLVAIPRRQSKTTLCTHWRQGLVVLVD